MNKTTEATWAEQHGYAQYHCPVCGKVFWTDGDPSQECCEKEEEEDDE